MPEPDDHYYIDGYSIADDPYVQPNGVLTNLLTITTTAGLGEAEALFVPLRTVELWEHPVPGAWDLAHLQQIHFRLFQDIYPWAGQCRQVDIAKGTTYFLRHDLIIPNARDIFADLAAERGLQGLGLETFCDRAAVYLARINFLHPFREGNGRAQREFIGQLAREAGFDVSWAGMSPDAMVQACIAACAWNFRPLHRLLRISLSVTADR